MYGPFSEKSMRRGVSSNSLQRCPTKHAPDGAQHGETTMTTTLTQPVSTRPSGNSSTHAPSTPPAVTKTNGMLALPEFPMSDEALAARLKELGVLRKGELSVINLRISDAVAASLAAASNVQAMLPRLLTLGSFNPELATALEAWAYVLRHTDIQANLSPPRYRFCTELIAEAKQLRRVLQAEAPYQTTHGVFADARLSKVSTSKAFARIARDLELLTEILDHHRDAWRNKSALSAEELERARTVAQSLARALLDKAEFSSHEWVDLRIRAFTMLRRAYAEARASLMYLLRNEPEAQHAIPPLAPSRTRTTRRQRERTRRAAANEHTTDSSTSIALRSIRWGNDRS